MSYTPTEWKTGDVVTSAKLNKLEQGVADVGGYSVTTTTQMICPEQSVTVSDEDGYGYFSAPLSVVEGYAPEDFPDSIIVTHNGTETVLPGSTSDGRTYYEDVSTPFWIEIYFQDESTIACNFCTENDGTYTVSVRTESVEVVVSPDFATAVKEIGGLLPVIEFTLGTLDENYETTDVTGSLSVSEVFSEIKSTGSPYIVHIFSDGYWGSGGGQSFVIQPKLGYNSQPSSMDDARYINFNIYQIDGVTNGESISVLCGYVQGDISGNSWTSAYLQESTLEVS